MLISGFKGLMRSFDFLILIFPGLDVPLITKTVVENIRGKVGYFLISRACNALKRSAWYWLG